MNQPITLSQAMLKRLEWSIRSLSNVESIEEHIEIVIDFLICSDAPSDLLTTS
jgi:hypothetical protein